MINRPADQEGFPVCAEPTETVDLKVHNPGASGETVSARCHGLLFYSETVSLNEAVCDVCDVT